MRFSFRNKVTLLALTTVAIAATATHLPAASLLEWNTAGNSGLETSEPSTFAAVNLAPAPLTLGPGVAPASNANRLGGDHWFDLLNTNPEPLASAMADNDYIQFIVAPNAGFSFTATGFIFVWERSGTGPDSLAFRSSADGFTSNLGIFTGLAASQTTDSIAFSLTSSSAITFRLYGFNATGTSGSGGFDTTSGNLTPNVVLTGTVNLLPPATPLPSSAFSGLTVLTLASALLCLRARRTLA